MHESHKAPLLELQILQLSTAQTHLLLLSLLYPSLQIIQIVPSLSSHFLQF